MTTNANNLNADTIKSIRENLGLGRTEFANLLGLGSQGERTVRGWETEEHRPSKKKIEAILALESQLKEIQGTAPLVFKEQTPSFKFIDLFAGIGGIRLPFQELGGECVFTSEWDKFAQKTYLANYADMPSGDITQIKAADVPDHDILLGGFPCQSFSQAGHGKGFSDTRGTMFFEIQRLLVEKRPKAFMLENVKQLRGHDKGRTLNTIQAILRGEFELEVPDDIPLSEEARKALSEKLNYWVDFKVLRAADFGVPQNRERVFIVGFDKDYYSEVDIAEQFAWPEPPCIPTKLGDILEDLSNISAAADKFTISDRLWAGHQKRKEQHKEKGNGFGYTLYNHDSDYTNTISARYYKDGSEILIDQSELGKNPRKLTPRECARLQGFPEEFIVDAVSQGQIYKQFGNSVCVDVVRAVAKSMITFMSSKLVKDKAA
ncbi:DNA (cytosine-5-)-methyltransferase [Marinomonas sp. RSW2]|uniref:Cytosine-specific methyltransferase n=1 Tax=Marinomonas maritima TaxID=2940935 RepID=A0ABT5W9H8_9GAMM|nr:DNA (cytosine-5-)-methyltransferase [Marinomonas maritima]MDE8601474.1 DNA (cytosine-5-)-methyltransferase [Marinomonas maritima]